MSDIYHSFDPMESENGRTLVNVGQEEENLNSVPSDGREDSQQASEQPSSATSGSSCKAESSEKPMENEKTLDGMYYLYLGHYKNLEISSVRI